MAKDARPQAAEEPLFRLLLADRIFLAIAGTTVLVRAAAAWRWPTIVQADEAGQYVEQAYRLLTGRGLVPWEFVIGARSWLLPGLAVPPMAIGRLISRSPEVWYGCVEAMMIGLSLITVASAYVIGRAAGSRLHGLLAALMTALWVENVYYSAHLLADTLGALLLVACLAAETRARSGRMMLALGALMGLTFVVRMQLAPALGLIGLAAAWPDPRSRLPRILLGGSAVVAASGLLDWATWGSPFHSTLTYFQANGRGVADSFGYAPLFYYPAKFVLGWGWATAPVLVAAGVGAWRARLPSAVAIVTLVLFSLVPHKEYRFIQPVVQVLMIVVGIGMAELIDKVRSWRPGAYPFAVAGGFAALAALSLATLLSPNTRALWRQNAGTLWALRQINQDPQSCGVALFPPADWYRAFRSQLRDDVPVFTPAASQPDAYNRALAFGGIKPDGGYALMGCRGDEAACLWRRPGSCNPALGSPLTASSTSETRRVLRRLGLKR